jgi:hypothetical protein
VLVERVTVVVESGGGIGAVGAVVLSVVVVVVGGGLPPQPASMVMLLNNIALASSRIPDLQFIMSISCCPGYGVEVVVDCVLVVAGGTGDCVVVVVLLSLLPSTVP